MLKHIKNKFVLKIFLALAIVVTVLIVWFISSTIIQFKKISDTTLFEKVPKGLYQAMVVTYDKKYYQHNRFGDTWPAMVRKGIYDLFYDRDDFGISYFAANKLLVNNAYKAPKPIILSRAVLGAWYLEMRLTREQVLYLFLRESTYAKEVEGADAATSSYFGKRLEELNLSESIVIVATADNNLNYRDKAYQILDLLHSEKYITDEEYTKTKRGDLPSAIFKFEYGFLNPPKGRPVSEAEMKEAYSAIETLPQIRKYLVKGGSHLSVMCPTSTNDGCYYENSDLLRVKLGYEGPIFATIDWYYYDRQTGAVYTDKLGGDGLVKLK